MPARLIVNADDFGLTPGINRAIAELHSAGVLTSATLMANGPAFDDAVAIAHTHPSLGVGCHLVLTDGIPVSPPDRIRTLLGSDCRTLRPSLPGFIQALLCGKIDTAEIETEARAQIHKIQAAGIAVTHLDTHKHTHIFPTITRVLLNVAESNNIPAIRNPFEPTWERALGHGSFPRRVIVRLLAQLRPRFLALLSSGRVVTTGGTLAISATGQLNRTTLAEILAAIPSTGIYELCCHPGYNDSDLASTTTRLLQHRNTERAALLSEIPRTLAATNPPNLVSYRDMSF